MRFYLLIILAAVSLYFLLKPNSNLEKTEVAANSAAQDVLAVKENREVKPKSEPVAVPQVEATNAALSSAEFEVQARANMGLMLNKLAECTEIKNTVSESTAEPTLTSILDSVQSDLGEPVIRSEDWNTTEIKMPDGGSRLIRIETVYEDDDIIKKLKYYQVTNQQTVNPSETFLASLEKEGEVASRERSERVFFQNGEEIMYIEKNGKIVSSEIIKAGKSLKCGDYGQKTFRCQCF
jgi:hypothetical protein